MLHAVHGRVTGVPLDDAMDGEGTREWSAVVEAAQQRHDLVQSLDERRRVEMMSGYELGDECADPGQFAEDRWTDAERGCAMGCLGLVRPIDAQQFGPLTRHAHDVVMPVECRHVVGVGDPAVKGSELHGPAGPGGYPRHECFDVDARHGHRL